MKILVLVSGGLDSAVALWDARRRGEVAALWFDYGSLQAREEEKRAEALCREAGAELRKVRLGFFRDNFKSGLLDGGITDAASSVVPFRNGVFASVAAGIAQSLGFDEVVIANHVTTDDYPDCGPAFSKAMADAVEAGTGGAVRFSLPLGLMSKAEVVKLGARLGTPFGLTYSCYKGGAGHCGVCPACAQRKKAFNDAGIEDPTEYES